MYFSSAMKLPRVRSREKPWLLNQFQLFQGKKELLKIKLKIGHWLLDIETLLIRSELSWFSANIHKYDIYTLLLLTVFNKNIFIPVFHTLLLIIIRVWKPILTPQTAAGGFSWLWSAESGRTCQWPIPYPLLMPAVLWNNKCRQ